MTERKNQCFNCGSESHYARDCPDSTHQFMQRKKPQPAPIPASTAARLAISPGNVRSLKRKGPEEPKGLRDQREKEESAPKELKGESDVSALRKIGESTGLDLPEERMMFNATTAKSTAISPETAKTVTLHGFREAS